MWPCARRSALSAERWERGNGGRASSPASGFSGLVAAAVSSLGGIVVSAVSSPTGRVRGGRSSSPIGRSGTNRERHPHFCGSALARFPSISPRLKAPS